MVPFVLAAAMSLAIQTPGTSSYDELVKNLAYDASASLDVREAGAEDLGGVKIHDISYVSPKGGRVPAYLVVPAGKGPFAAVIWGHWYWQNSAFRNRREFLDEAVALAASGVVSLLFDGPVARPGFAPGRSAFDERQFADRVQAILDVRRGADLLLSRPDIDPSRLAYVGHSYNASIGGLLAGVDRRFKAFVLMAGSLSDKVDFSSEPYRRYRERAGPERFDAFVAKFSWLDPGVSLPHAAPAAVLMQYATKEDFLTVERAKQYAALVSEPKKFKVYDATHALNGAARRDRIEFLREQLGLRTVDWNAIRAVPGLVQPPAVPPVQRKTCTAPDGVNIVYSTAGTGDTALVFIHGGLADRSFFDAEFDAFSDRYRVIALDLGGHGESGTNRAKWGIGEFAGDVKAVVDAERLQRAILFGNSLGGPVAIEAALLLPGKVIGVVGIDTFQDLAHGGSADYIREVTAYQRKQAEAFRTDFTAATKAMVKMLFHPDTDPRLVAEAERRMLRTSPDTAKAMMAAIAGYNTSVAARKLAVPLRAINGDLFPMDVPAARKVRPDFDAVVMKHTGHYPMIEHPEDFNRNVAAVVEELDSRKQYGAT